MIPVSVDPLQTVKEMAAACEQGRTPALLEQFLRETFPKRPGGWVWQWLSGPCRYDVRKVEPFEDAGFFRASCVFWVFARDDLLEGAVLPSGGTYGLFALGRDGVRYLNRRRENLEALLRAERRPLEECSPLVLASLVAEALGRNRNSSHDVITSLDHLASYDGDLDGGFGGGYELDASEWKRVRAAIAPPVISGNLDRGWHLTFLSVFGWMHEKRTLVRHHLRFTADFGIEEKKEILSRKIFKTTPAIRY